MPAAYVEEQAAAAPRLPPAPPSAKAKPVPPTKRPVAGGRKPADLAQRDSGMSLNGTGGDSGRSTPSLGGSLADALLARKNALNQKRDDETDDW